MSRQHIVCLSDSFQMDSALSPSMDVDPSLTFIRCPASELRKFKVLGTIDKVILVLDKDSEETFVIKVRGIEYLAYNENDSRTFMVKTQVRCWL